VRELAGNLETLIRKYGGELVEDVIYVREYQGPQIGENEKSVTFRITVRAVDRTLSAEEIQAVRTQIGLGLVGDSNYNLRV
jgi:phenylalanyl-tRNA synthetase beta chain